MGVTIDKNLLKKKLETVGWLGVRELFYNNAKCKRVLPTHGFICCTKDFEHFYFLQQTSPDQTAEYNSKLITDPSRTFSYFYSLKNLPGDSLEEIEYIMYSDPSLIETPFERKIYYDDRTKSDREYNEKVAEFLNHHDPELFSKLYTANNCENTTGMKRSTTPNEDYQTVNIITGKEIPALIKKDAEVPVNKIDEVDDFTVTHTTAGQFGQPEKRLGYKSIVLNDGTFLPFYIVKRFYDNQKKFKEYMAKMLGKNVNDFY